MSIKTEQQKEKERKEYLYKFADTISRADYLTLFILNQIEELKTPIKFTVDTNQWFLWSGKVWQEKSENEIKGLCGRILDWKLPDEFHNLKAPKQFLEQDTTSISDLKNNLKECDKLIDENYEVTKVKQCKRDIQRRIKEIENTENGIPEECNLITSPEYYIYQYCVRQLRRKIKACSDVTLLGKIASDLKTRRKIQSSIYDFDRMNEVMNFENGTFDLVKKQLRNHNFDDMLTQYIPYEYKEDADTSPWIKYLKDWFPDNDLQKYIQSVMGYILSGNLSEKTFWFFYGDSNTGKSTFINIINRLAGDTDEGQKTSYLTYPPEQVFLKASDEGAKSILSCVNKRMLIINELSDNKSWDTDMLKKWTGHDRLSVRILGSHNTIRITPKGSIIATGNSLPYSRRYDEVFQKRIIIVPFVNVITDAIKKKHGSYKSESNFIQSFDKIMPSIIKWIIEGYYMYQSNQYVIPEIVKQANQEYKETSNPLNNWQSDCITQGEKYRTTKTDMWKSYLNWAMDKQISPQDRLNSRDFYKQIEKKFVFARSRENGKLTSTYYADGFGVIGNSQTIIFPKDIKKKVANFK